MTVRATFRQWHNEFTLTLRSSSPTALGRRAFCRDGCWWQATVENPTLGHLWGRIYEAGLFCRHSGTVWTADIVADLGHGLRWLPGTHRQVRFRFGYDRQVWGSEELAIPAGVIFDLASQLRRTEGVLPISGDEERAWEEFAPVLEAARREATVVDIEMGLRHPSRSIRRRNAAELARVYLEELTEVLCRRGVSLVAAERAALRLRDFVRSLHPSDVTPQAVWDFWQSLELTAPPAAPATSELLGW